ncbi:MAG: 2-oxoglutarate dehydrogenase complex dihydrolipoyllysine-residue succinyltransferase [Marinilabiliales bacterium]
MIIDIKIPSPGESISEVELTKWLVNDGEFVEKEQEIAEIESEKASLTIFAEETGKIKIIEKEGKTLPVGAIIGQIDTEQKQPEKDNKNDTIIKKSNETTPQEKNVKPKITPLARNIIEKNNLSIEPEPKKEKITKNDVIELINNQKTKEVNQTDKTFSRNYTKQPISQLRKKLSQRLVTAKNETAMLTTFNEIDMSNVMQLKNKYKEKFLETYGVKLGFMSFFAKACAIALMKHKNINARLDEDEIIYFNYADIGIAVQTDRGLMVPVIKNVESLEIPDIEIKIADLANRARNKKISIDELEGGTFTISNGGVFGSMLSTPIINYPQAAILGMHNIIERPVAIDGKIEIRPMMYVALSYDHRLIDGKDSVGFLVFLKSLIENPINILFKDINPETLLFNF